MQVELVFAGFGGQGVMVGGQLLAHAAMEEGKHVIWLPSYGPEMRGGTANCTVVVSDKPISSPVVPNPQTVIAMNNPSLDRFGHLVKAGGLIVVNSSLVNISFQREDIKIVHIPGNDIALECGNPKAANMVMLSAWLYHTKAVQPQAIERMLEMKLGHKKELLEVNRAALKKGWDYFS